MKAKIQGWDCDASFPEQGVTAERELRNRRNDVSIELDRDGNLYVEINDNSPYHGYCASVTIPAAVLEWLDKARKEAGK